MASMSTQRASSMSSSSPSTSSSTPRWKYDVFLSFYGKDTRKNFTDHLYAALQQKGIITFRDDEKLERGEFIDAGLLKAIEESKYAVAVLSANYAFSSWCLIELAKIVECMEKTGLTILPVFYYVDPSHVRKQADTFAEAFAKHETDPRIDITDVQRWKAAFRQVGKIAGWHLHDGYESTVVKGIIARIYSEWNTRLSSVSKDLVGIEFRAEEMMKLLDIESDDVRFIGISGMGGVGKTTLAKVICDRISHQFEASSFISNVREKADKHGLVYLQRKLLSDILMEREIIKGWDDRRVSNEMGSRLGGTKVLITLDDVNKANQLEALAGGYGWFGRGSRVIVTSRDKQLLKSHGVQHPYIVRGLDNDEALQLFSWKALGKPHPEENYFDLSIDFVKYANGLPLALKVLGSSLFDKPTDIWEISRDQLKANPEREIFDILEIGFDKLGDMEKSLFLDIACFFKGEDKDSIKDVLKSLGYHPDSKKNIDVLVDKSLISILGRKLWMHDLLQEMGQKIVRREFPEEPGKLSRLWLWEDAIPVLKNGEGTEVVKGIVLNLPPQREEYDELNAEAFSNMKKMRLLKISNVRFPRGLSYLSNELRLIEWHGYPLKSLPTSFQPENLVKLCMHCSHIEQLWKGNMNSNNLKYIDLSDSKKLIKTPDFSGTPNLETLILQGCTSLYWVHPSIGVLKRLIILNLRGCKCLKNLPHKISLESLQIFDLSGCSRFEKFPEIEGNMTHLSEIYLDGTSIKELPSSFESLCGLILLSLRDCQNLSILPSVIVSLSSLKTLILSGCSRLDKMREKRISMECLLFCCSFLLSGRTDPMIISLLLLDSFSGLSSLISLDLSDCNLSDRAIPSDLRGLSSLQSLNLKGNKFTSIPDGICHLSSLISLNLSYCNLSDGAIPSDLRGLSSLQSLDISGNEFTSIPDSICQLSKLIELHLRDCRMLRSFPELPSSVLYVWAHGCTSLETYSDQTNLWTSNETATIIDCSTSAKHEDKKIHRIPVSDAQIPLLVGKNLKAEIDHSNVFCISSSLQTEIPKWFTIQSTDSSATLPLHVELDNKSKWAGYTMFVVYEVRDDENLNSRTSNLRDGHQFVCHFETDRLKQPLALRVPRVPSVKRIGMWVYLPYAWFSKRSNNLDKWSFIEASVTSGSLGVDVKKFGVRLLNECDASEFLEDVRRRSLGGLDNGSHSSYYKLGNYILDLPTSVGHVEYSSNDSNCNSIPCPVSFEDKDSKVDSIVQLKDDLQKLLSKLFEVKYAKNKIYKYIFPLSESKLLRWFIAHGFGSAAAMTYLPPNLYDDESWIGFALYASFAVQKPPYVSGDNPCSKISFNFLCFLETNDDCLQPLVIFPVTEDNFVESHRLVMFHIPRVFFNHKLNQQNSIKAIFGCCDNPDMEVQTCGIRMVYAQDLDGFVETIVDHMLRSPDVHHQDYHRRLLDQVESLPNYVLHEVRSSEPLEGKMPSDFCQSSSLQRRLRSLQKQPSSIEHIARLKSTSLATYSGQVTAKGTASRDSTSFNVGQDFYEHQTYSNCFLEYEVPEWFSGYNGSSMKIKLPLDFCDNSNWKGIALYASFKILKHPNLRSNDRGTEISHGISCYVGRDIGWTIVIPHTITETELNKSIGLNQNRFIWVLYIPRGLILGEQKKCNLTISVLFGSESQHLMVQKCGCSLVHQQNVREFEQTIIQCSTASPNNSHQFVADDEGQTSGIGSSKETLARKCIRFLRKRSKDIDKFDAYEYDNCFPPSEILQLFSSRNTGPTVTIELLENDLNWTGIALCASFSVKDYPTKPLDNLGAEIPHHLICLFETDIDSLKPLHVYRTTREEFKWSILHGFIWLSYIPYRCLPNGINRCNRIEASIVSDWSGVTVQKCGLRLVHGQDGRDIWQIMFHCAVSFLDNWDLFRRDVAQQDCIAPATFSIYVEDYASMVSGSTSNTRPISADKQGCKSDSTRPLKGNQEGFDPYSALDIVLPQIETLKWFSHQSRGHSVAIQLPPNLCNDNDWIGLALCASFSVDEHQTFKFHDLDSDVPHNLTWLVTTNTGDLQHPLCVNCTLKEKFISLYARGSVWLYYIPRASLPNVLSHGSQIEASFRSDWPELTVNYCGLRLFYHQDVHQFEQTIKECAASGFYNNIDLIRQLTEADATNNNQNNKDGFPYKDPYPERFRKPSYQGQSSGSGILFEDQHPDQNQLLKCGPVVFDRGFVHDFCFPPSDILEWFIHRNNEPFVVTKIPPGSYNNMNWIGLALCASFAAHEQPSVILDTLDSKTSHCLICHLETDSPDCVHPPHVYCTNKEDFTSLHLGGFTWLSYIPRGSLPDWSSQGSHIKASFLNDCPNLIVKECGVRLIYKHDEEEFEQMIRHCMKLLSDSWDTIDDRKKNEKKHDNEARSSRSGGSNEDSYTKPLRGPIDPMLKDKGKRVLE